MSKILTSHPVILSRIKQSKTNKHNEKECKICHYELIYNLSHRLSQITFGLKTPTEIDGAVYWVLWQYRKDIPPHFSNCS